MKRLQKAWVFVSHSTQDIDDVRRVRNEVEQQGGEPLLFFLKCVSDSDELDDLLKREIEARRYFLLCDSVAASASKWVKEEVSHVQSLPGKRFETIDLSAQWKHQVAAISRLLRDATVFPVYADADRSTVEPLLATLKSQEFSVFDAFDRSVSLSKLGDEINSAIDRSGFLLHFLSSASLNSHWCQLEARYFLESKERTSGYIPVLLERGLSFDSFPEARNWVTIDFSEKDEAAFAEQVSRVLYD